LISKDSSRPLDNLINFINLQFPVRSTTFSILLLWAFFRGFVFLSTVNNFTQLHKHSLCKINKILLQTFLAWAYRNILIQIHVYCYFSFAKNRSATIVILCRINDKNFPLFSKDDKSYSKALNMLYISVQVSTIIWLQRHLVSH
jgi:hypothetical protein